MTVAVLDSIAVAHDTFLASFPEPAFHVLEVIVSNSLEAEDSTLAVAVVVDTFDHL